MLGALPGPLHSRRLVDDARSILELRWTASTAEMTDDDFKRGLEHLAGHAEMLRPRSIIVDAREFKHRPDPSVGPWRDETIIPRYNGSGIQKFGFLLPPGAAPDKPPAPEPPGTFPTGYVDTRDALVSWLTAAVD